MNLKNKSEPEQSQHDKCSHGHSHNHGHHAHLHGVTERVGIAFFINLAFAVIELVGGFLTNSMAIMSDALHDFGDSVALGFAWWLERKSNQPSDIKFSYGYRRLSIFSAFLTGVLLVTGSSFILFNSVQRLLTPQNVEAKGMFLLAILGVIINAAAFFRLSKGISLNEKMLSWHFIEDLMGWVVVLFGSVLMMYFEIPWLDPLLAIMLSCWVIWNVLKHLKATINIFLQLTPEHLQNDTIQKFIMLDSIVHEVHHTHVWSLDGERHIMTSHLVLKSGTSWNEISNLKQRLKSSLRDKFQILEVNLEIELEGQSCVDRVH